MRIAHRLNVIGRFWRFHRRILRVSGERTTSCVACASVPDLDGGVVRLRVVVLLVGCAKLCVIELRSRKTEPAPRSRALPDCRMMEAKTFLALLLTLWTDRHEKPPALGACRKEICAEVQGLGFIGRHGEFVVVMAW